MKGIDVSKWQGYIDWNKVKAAGIEFAIIRAGYGKESYQKDAYFERNYVGAKKAGIPCGVYWYSYATNEAEAREEAKACLAVIKGKQFEFPIYYDVEEKASFPKANKLIEIFCGELELAGYFAGVYMSRWPLTNYVSESVRKRYALWIAEYGPKLNYDGQYGIWQNSSEGSVAGINGNVDTDICRVDYPSIIKKKGLNGFRADSVNNVKKDVQNSVYTVKTGDTLWGIAMKHGTSVDKLAKLNGITNVNLIYPGQEIKIK